MNKRIRYLIRYILILSMFSAMKIAAAAEEDGEIVVNRDFESGNLVGLVCSGNCPVVAILPEAGSNFAGSFELTRSMSTPYRTEIDLGGVGKLGFNREYWLNLQYRYEDWGRDSNAEIAPFQIHTRASDWSQKCSLGSAVGSAPFLMMSVNDEVRFITYGGKILWRGAVQKKQWLAVKVHFKISTGADGFVEAWKDGVKLGRVDGANSPMLDNCGLPMRTPYFKMGVYKWDWQAGRPPTQSTRRQLFIDNLKIALIPVPVSDTTPPLISDVVMQYTCSLATVKWVTDEPTMGEIAVGRSDAYGDIVRDPIMVTRHQVQFPIVPDGLDWWVRIDSVDAAGNKAAPTTRRFVVQ